MNRELSTESSPKSDIKKIDPILEKFTDKPAHVYSPPPGDDDNNKECDLPFCDNFVTFSNPLFDFNDDFTSSDDESFPEEDDAESKDSYEPDLLFTPLSDANEDECFDPGGNINEINALLDMDVSTDIEDDYYDSE
ncbi:hypothetical protein Tco_1363563 [Tanacetum coccineum]